MFDYVKTAQLQFRRPLIKRKVTEGIVVHHLAGRGSVEQVHRQELAAHPTWAGIGYNVYVRRDGTVWWGRGLEQVGAHAGRTVLSSPDYPAALHNNDRTVGVGFEGWYCAGHDKRMPAAQFDAGVRVLRDLLVCYGSGIFIRGHRDMPATATACPGENFPLREMIASAREQAQQGEQALLAGVIAAEAGVFGDGCPNGLLAVGQCALDLAQVRSLTLEQALRTHFAPGAQPVPAPCLEAAKRALAGERRFPGAKLLQLRSYGKYGQNGLPDREKLADLLRAYRYLGKDGVSPRWGHFYFGLWVQPFSRFLRLASPNLRGQDVLTLQQALNAGEAGIAEDGIFGPATAAALRAYQKGAGLSPDGVLGPDTCAALGLDWQA